MSFPSLRMHAGERYRLRSVHKRQLPPRKISSLRSYRLDCMSLTLNRYARANVKN